MQNEKVGGSFKNLLGSTQESQLDIISGGEVSTFFSSVSNVRALSLTNPELILPGNFSPLPIHMQLNSLAQQKVACMKEIQETIVMSSFALLQVYYLFNVWSLNVTEGAPPGCPTKEGYLNPGDDFG